MYNSDRLLRRTEQIDPGKREDLKDQIPLHRIGSHGRGNLALNQQTSPRNGRDRKIIESRSVRRVYEQNQS